jgi:hypothetical protein
MLAAMLTKHRGECIFRLGMRPINPRLFGTQLVPDGTDAWVGTPRTTDELDVLKTELKKVVEEIGGKVRSAKKASTYRLY